MRRKSRVCIALMVPVVACFGVPDFAQDSTQDLRKEIETLKQGQEKIYRELQEIKAMIRASQAGAPSNPGIKNIEFSIGTNPAQGESTAAVTLVEFTDYQ